jgi:eukaryotic-like serine/threonine-protein kinase
MLDGRGRVRITDFGLAVAAEEAASLGEVAGTPAYMAPEQLSGKPPSVRSDVYALGLVLYEIGTGRRAFDASNLAELRRKHEEEAPPAPSAVVPGFDPAVERVILRCLEKDPRSRPASALQVAAALPGGDPLAAALAAGETPSPEMVAAAGPEGAISTAKAAALLAGIVGLLVLTIALSRWGTDLGLSPLPKPPDVLEERAREVAEKLGWADPPADTGRRFVRDETFLRFLARTGRPGWARELRELWWKPATFEYRQSPRPMQPANSVGEVRRSDPPLEVTGMVSIALDPGGRLRRFVAVPPQVLKDGDAQPRPAWDALFAEAGLDRKAFHEAPPAWLPQVPFDTIAGWDGPMPGPGGYTLRIVAAAFRGRPVSFEVIAPWSAATRDAPRPRGVRVRMAEQTFALSIILVFGAAAWFARRNARLGRGDRSGAARIGGVTLVAAVVSAVLEVHPGLSGLQLVTPLVFMPVANWAFVWVLYLAFEPYVRRHYADLLVSWTRLVGGRLQDPLVGRDLLCGSLIGCGMMLLTVAMGTAPTFAASRGQTPWFFEGAALDGTSALVARAALHFTQSIGATVLHTAILFVATVLLRKRALAIACVWLFRFILESGQENALLEIPVAALLATLTVIALLRFGLVGLAALNFVDFELSSAPFTIDFSAWYSGHALFIVALVLAVAVWGFRAARGGGMLLPAVALDD